MEDRGGDRTAADDAGAPSSRERRKRRPVQTGSTRAERERRGTAPRLSLDTVLQNPIRNGLIGLAVAGTAAPIGIARHQEGLRTDPSHETALARAQAQTAPGRPEDAVAGVWQALEADASAEERRREEIIRRSLERYAEYDLTRDLAEQIYDQAVEHGIDPEIAFGLVRAESSFRNTSTSVVGAVGLTQLMPRTAAGVEPGISPTELREPKTNLRIGFKYLRSLIDKYGDTDLALTAYNRGPGTVDRELKRGRDPDNGYAAFVRGREGHGHRLFTSS